MHEHTEPKKCKHELKYCVKCDTVYCEKCHEEWKKEQYTGNVIGDIDKWWKKREIGDPKPYWMEENINFCKHAEDL